MELEDLDVPTFSDEEAAFIASLEAPATDYTGDTDAPAANDDLALQGATGTALMLINAAETITKQLAHPQFHWGEAEKKTTADAIAPVLVKNGGQLPEWLEPYKEEAFALFAVGALAFGGYMQVKALKELDEQKKATEKTNSDLEENPIAA